MTFEEFLNSEKHIAVLCKDFNDAKFIYKKFKLYRGNLKNEKEWFDRIESCTNIILYNDFGQDGWPSWDYADRTNSAEIIYTIKELFNDLHTEEKQIEELEKQIEELKEKIKNRKPTLIEDERVILRNVNEKWKYIMRNKYTHTLELSDIEPIGVNICTLLELPFNGLFNFVTEDKYYKIDDLLGD